MLPHAKLLDLSGRGIDAKSMLLIVYPSATDRSAIWELVDSKTVLFVRLPGAYELTTIAPVHRSKACHGVGFELSHEHLTCFEPVKLSKAVFLPVNPPTDILRTIHDF